MTISWILILFAGTVVGLFLLGVILILQKRSSDPSAGLNLLQQQFSALRSEMQQAIEGFQRGFQERLGENTQMMQRTHGVIGERLGDAAQLVGEVRQQLGSMIEQQKRIYEVGKDISSLQEILQAPKLRGGFGEFLLGDLLGQVLPREHFEMPYSFRSGEKVDAVVRLKEGIVPIDSKFPLENFRRILEASTEEEKKRLRKELGQDLKIHVDVIAKKYIAPDEGTLPFALMYIPVEGVYYETVIREEISYGEKSFARYAREKNIFLVSPQSLYLYLSTVAMGLKGLKIEKRTEEILRHLDRLQSEIGRFGEEFRKLGAHLQNARSSYDKAEKQLNRFHERLQSHLPESISSERAPLVAPLEIPDRTLET
jgi:DNA recombination protein RmuC